MKEKCFIRRIEYSTSCVTTITYDSFNDIWCTVGCFGFSPYCYKVRVPYSVQFLNDFFGDDLLFKHCCLHWNQTKDKLLSIQCGNKFLKTDIPTKKVYSEEFINKIMKENFSFYRD